MPEYSGKPIDPSLPVFDNPEPLPPAEESDEPKTILVSKPHPDAEGVSLWGLVPAEVNGVKLSPEEAEEAFKQGTLEPTQTFLDPFDAQLAQAGVDKASSLTGEALEIYYSDVIENRLVEADLTPYDPSYPPRDPSKRDELPTFPVIPVDDEEGSDTPGIIPTEEEEVEGDKLVTSVIPVEEESPDNRVSPDLSGFFESLQTGEEYRKPPELELDPLRFDPSGAEQLKGIRDQLAGIPKAEAEAPFAESSTSQYIRDSLEGSAIGDAITDVYDFTKNTVGASLEDISEQTQSIGLMFSDILESAGLKEGPSKEDIQKMNQAFSSSEYRSNVQRKFGDSPFSGKKMEEALRGDNPYGDAMALIMDRKATTASEGLSAIGPSLVPAAGGIGAGALAVGAGFGPVGVAVAGTGVMLLGTLIQTAGPSYVKSLAENGDKSLALKTGLAEGMVASGFAGASIGALKVLAKWIPGSDFTKFLHRALYNSGMASKKNSAALAQATGIQVPAVAAEVLTEIGTDVVNETVVQGKTLEELSRAQVLQTGLAAFIAGVPVKGAELKMGDQASVEQAVAMRVAKKARTKDLTPDEIRLAKEIADNPDAEVISPLAQEILKERKKNLKGVEKMTVALAGDSVLLNSEFSIEGEVATAKKEITDQVNTAHLDKAGLTEDVEQMEQDFRAEVEANQEEPIILDEEDEGGGEEIRDLKRDSQTKSSKRAYGNIDKTIEANERGEGNLGPGGAIALKARRTVLNFVSAAGQDGKATLPDIERGTRTMIATINILKDSKRNNFTTLEEAFDALELNALPNLEANENIADAVVDVLKEQYTEIEGQTVNDTLTDPESVLGQNAIEEFEGQDTQRTDPKSKFDDEFKKKMGEEFEEKVVAPTENPYEAELKRSAEELANFQAIEALKLGIKPPEKKQRKNFFADVKTTENEPIPTRKRKNVLSKAKDVATALDDLKDHQVLDPDPNSAESKELVSKLVESIEQFEKDVQEESVRKSKEFSDEILNVLLPESQAVEAQKAKSIEEQMKDAEALLEQASPGADISNLSLQEKLEHFDKLSRQALIHDQEGAIFLSSLREAQETLEFLGKPYESKLTKESLDKNRIKIPTDPGQFKRFLQEKLVNRAKKAAATVNVEPQSVESPFPPPPEFTTLFDKLEDAMGGILPKEIKQKFVRNLSRARDGKLMGHAAIEDPRGRRAAIFSVLFEMAGLTKESEVKAAQGDPELLAKLGPSVKVDLSREIDSVTEMLSNSIDDIQARQEERIIPDKIEEVREKVKTEDKVDPSSEEGREIVAQRLEDELPTFRMKVANKLGIDPEHVTSQTIKMADRVYGSTSEHLKSGKIMLTFFKDANLRTFTHENAHVIRMVLGEGSPELKHIRTAISMPEDANWNDIDENGVPIWEERFAERMEHWVAHWSEAPHQVQHLWTRLKDFVMANLFLMSRPEEIYYRLDDKYIDRLGKRENFDKLSKEKQRAVRQEMIDRILNRLLIDKTSGQRLVGLPQHISGKFAPKDGFFEGMGGMMTNTVLNSRMKVVEEIMDFSGKYKEGTPISQNPYSMVRKFLGSSGVVYRSMMSGLYNPYGKDLAKLMVVMEKGARFHKDGILVWPHLKKEDAKPGDTGFYHGESGEKIVNLGVDKDGFPVPFKRKESLLNILEHWGMLFKKGKALRSDSKVLRTEDGKNVLEDPVEFSKLAHKMWKSKEVLRKTLADIELFPGISGLSRITELRSLTPELKKQYKKELKAHEDLMSLVDAEHGTAEHQVLSALADIFDSYDTMLRDAREYMYASQVYIDISPGHLANADIAIMKKLGRLGKYSKVVEEGGMLAGLEAIFDSVIQISDRNKAHTELTKALQAAVGLGADISGVVGRKLNPHELAVLGKTDTKGELKQKTIMAKLRKEFGFTKLDEQTFGKEAVHTVHGFSIDKDTGKVTTTEDSWIFSEPLQDLYFSLEPETRMLYRILHDLIGTPFEFTKQMLIRNPVFVARNLPRDIQTALGVTRTAKEFRKEKGTILGSLHYMKLAAKVAADKVGLLFRPTTQRGTKGSFGEGVSTETFLRESVGQGFVDVEGARQDWGSAMGKALKQFYVSGNDIVLTGPTLSKLTLVFKRVINSVPGLNRIPGFTSKTIKAGEDFTRDVEMVAQLETKLKEIGIDLGKMTESQVEALLQDSEQMAKVPDIILGAARESSDLMDFAETSYFFRHFEKVFKFSNAWRIGLRRLLYSLKDSPDVSLDKDQVKKNLVPMLFTLGVSTIPFIMLARIGTEAFSEEDEGEDPLHEPAHVKDSSLTAPLGGNLKLRYPIGFEVPVIASAFTRLADSWLYDRSLRQSFAGYGGSLRRAFTPADDIMGIVKFMGRATQGREGFMSEHEAQLPVHERLGNKHFGATIQYLQREWNLDGRVFEDFLGDTFGYLGRQVVDVDRFFLGGKKRPEETMTHIFLKSIVGYGYSASIYNSSQVKELYRIAKEEENSIAIGAARTVKLLERKYYQAGDVQDFEGAEAFRKEAWKIAADALTEIYSEKD